MNMKWTMIAVEMIGWRAVAGNRHLDQWGNMVREPTQTEYKYGRVWIRPYREGDEGRRMSNGRRWVAVWPSIQKAREMMDYVVHPRVGIRREWRPGLGRYQEGWRWREEEQGE